jgi:dTDP-4-amino-4,6-dideoxygalactose transaminase
VSLRFPILARDRAHRTRLRTRLRTVGISASASYPTTIREIPGITRYLAPAQHACPGAASIATRIVTLPTHPDVSTDDVERMIEVIRQDRDPRASEARA